MYRDHIYNLSLDNWSAFLRPDKTPKPAFYAAKNMIALVQDKGTAFTPKSLDYAWEGDQLNLRQTLLQKRDGRFLLAVWLNVSSTGGGNNNHNDVETNRALTLKLGQGAASVKTYLPTFGGTGATTTSKDVTSTKLNVSDQVTLIEITPAGSATATPVPTGTKGDINGDGKVNVIDLSLLLSKWGGSDTAGDLNGDGRVGVLDLSVLLAGWSKS